MCSSCETASGISLADTIASIALLLSGISLLYSVFIIYKTKKIEILYQEFENLCLKNVSHIFSGIDNIFEQHENSIASEHLSHITSITTEIQTYVIILKENVYKNIDVKEIILITEFFSEKLYEFPKSKIFEFKSEYYSAKIKIYDALYRHAVKKEIRFAWFFNKR